MKVKNLIDLLSNLPPDLPVYIWIDGDRYPIIDVDNFWINEGGHVDIKSALIENFGGY
jgi:hypothetical protein